MINKLLINQSKDTLLNLMILGLVVYYLFVIQFVWDALAVLIHFGLPVPDWWIFSTSGHTVQHHLISAGATGLGITIIGMGPLVRLKKVIVDLLTKQGERRMIRCPKGCEGVVVDIGNGQDDDDVDAPLMLCNDYDGDVETYAYGLVAYVCADCDALFAVAAEPYGGEET
jgi:hypothetical protein